MRVVVPSEIRPGEKRVALVPDVVSKLTKLGHEVIVQSGAGVHSQASDNEFTAAGAQVVNGDVLASADVLVSIIEDDAGGYSMLRHCRGDSDRTRPKR